MQMRRMTVIASMDETIEYEFNVLMYPRNGNAMNIQGRKHIIFEEIAGKIQLFHIFVSEPFAMHLLLLIVEGSRACLKCGIPRNILASVKFN